MKKYRMYISGKTSSRHTNSILHQMLPNLGFSEENGTGSDQIPSIRNIHRDAEETYFDVEIHDDDNAESIIDSMRRYLIDNAVTYEDTTTEPPKKYNTTG